MVVLVSSDAFPTKGCNDKVESGEWRGGFDGGAEAMERSDLIIVVEEKRGNIYI